MNDFDKIAHVYDPLKRIVFGENLYSLERALINTSAIEGDVLFVGGGTGQCLAELSKKTRGEIHYVEKSSRMLSIASKRVTTGNVTFHNIPLEQFDLTSYDVIITSFFLDVFDKKMLDHQIQRLSQSLKPGGRWLYADFQKPELFHHKFLLRSMFVFFKFFAGLQSRKLDNHTSLLESYGLVNTYTSKVLSGFAAGKIFEKPILPGS